MRSKLAIVLAVVLAVVRVQPAAAQALTPPLAANAFITIDGLDWAWASPCGFNLPGSCVSDFVLVDGFRFATADEWAARPDPSAFLDPAGNFAGTGGQMRCASSWFNVSPEYGHCDWDDAVGGFVSSGPDNLGPAQHPNAETWLVRGEGDGGGSVVPEPATYFLLATGLTAMGLVGRVRGRRKLTQDG